MSRLYEMYVRITDFNPQHTEEIKEEAEKEWNFDEGEWFNSKEFTNEPAYLSSNAQGNLCGGEEEGEFAARLTETIWKANKGFCKVEVVATYLENIPSERYEKDEEDYEAFIEDNAEEDRRDEKNGLYPGKEDIAN